MHVRLKPLNEQVMVITGAASGIGLVTARMAAEAGARVVLVARDEQSLAEAMQRITGAGGQALPVVADVSDEAAVQRVMDTTVDRFGRIDTWVNNAGVGIYGRATEVALEDARRLMDINFWGQVYGSLAAVRHLRQRGGQSGPLAIINVGSTESDQPLPLHSYYAASKHALKGFTNALRLELEQEGLPVSVTLIKPGSINTPFIQHAQNYMAKEANYPPPVYEPEVVARTILHAAQHTRRDMFAGGGGWMMSAMGRYAPRLTDWFMERSMFQKQQQDAPPTTANALYGPGAHGGSERGTYPGRVRKTSLYTASELHPTATKLGLLCTAAAVGTALWLINREPPRKTPMSRAAVGARRLTHAGRHLFDGR